MRAAGALAGALVILLTVLAGAGGEAPERAAGLPDLAAAQTRLPAGTENGSRLQAKSRKKRNTPTPMPAAAEEERQGSGRSQEFPGDPTPTPVPDGPVIDPQSIADYLFSHDMRLPDNFITKKEARQLGWDSAWNYVSDVAPGKSIGGDYFGNYEGKLPTEKGVTYREADCYYRKGKRNAFRIIYSSEGRVWYTEDHYNTFTELFPSVPGGGADGT